MHVVGKLALGFVLVGALTCATVSAQSQDAQNPYQADLLNFQNTHQSRPQPAQLAKQYVEAMKEEEKREIRKRLAEMLSQQFDGHVKQQQKELEELEKQIASLKKVLQRRLDAKSTIVERRLEQLIHDAEGLGWNAPTSPHSLYQWSNSSPKGAFPFSGPETK